MIPHKRRPNIKPISTMKTRQLLSNMNILPSPAHEIPTPRRPPSSPLIPRQHENRKHGLGFMRGVKIVLVVVDVDGGEDAVAPDFDGEEEDSGVEVPVWEDLVYGLVCLVAVGLCVQVGFCACFDDESLGVGGFEDFLADGWEVGHEEVRHCCS